MGKLSVVLATFNEEKNLRRVLESVRDLAYEIIIVDGTSTDNTVEIAKEFGARVKITTNKPNFHINKQMAIDMAKGSWILQMDADEVVPPELAKEIKEVISQVPTRNNQPPINGYWIPRKNWFLGHFLMKGGQYPDYTLRLYKKGKGRLPMKDVHEQAEVEGEVGHLREALLHYPYEDFKFYLSKWNRYNDFAANQIREEEKSKNIFEKVLNACSYLFFKPIHWFLLTYIRHKGFVDSWQGFTFSLFSALRFPVSYIKYKGTWSFTVVVVILIALILRFYNFQFRWGLAGDDARDAMVGLEALRRGALPLMGPFSSAGPFVFGGIYYWFIMLSYSIFPFLISAPWFFLSVVGVITAVVIAYIGREIGGWKLGAIAGLLAATSPQLVIRSSLLGPHSFISFFASMTVLSALLLWRTKKLIYSFILGISIGLAFSFHYQAVNLLIFFPAIFFINPLKINDKIAAFFIAILGFIIPSLPLLYWDSHQGFANLRNVADYLLIGQYRLYVPNSWTIFIFHSLPGYWSFVVGRDQIFSMFIFLLAGIFFMYSLFKKRISGKLFFLTAILFILVIVSRYYHGERSEGYLLYFVPFIILLAAWLFTNLISGKKGYQQFLGIALLAITFVLNLSADVGYIFLKSPAQSYINLANNLYLKFPETRFSIYDYRYKLYNSSMPLALIMSFDGKSDVNGKKIGISCTLPGCPSLPVIIDKGMYIQDVGGVSEASLDKNRKIWINVNQESVYDDQVGWLNKYQLKSNFSFQKYLQNKLNL